jgi:hypothetical protein
VGVTVCLHCGESAPEGALFCTKCGFTLPQPGASAPVPPSGAVPPAAPRPVAPPIASSSHPGPFGAPPPTPFPGYGPIGPYAVAAPAVPGAVGPVPPPPVGKYCIRCRSVIATPAVYCPVCQTPQP